MYYIFKYFFCKYWFNIIIKKKGIFEIKINDTYLSLIVYKKCINICFDSNLIGFVWNDFQIKKDEVEYYNLNIYVYMYICIHMIIYLSRIEWRAQVQQTTVILYKCTRYFFLMLCHYDVTFANITATLYLFVAFIIAYPSFVFNTRVHFEKRCIIYIWALFFTRRY